MVKDYLSVEIEYTFDDNLIYTIMGSVAKHVIGYTSMSILELDENSQSVLIFLLIVSELYNVRLVNLGTGTSGIYNKMLDKLMVSLKQDWL